MTPITELCQVIRSKNSGPYELTLDLIFRRREDYEKVKLAKALTRSDIARLYKIPESDILNLVYFDPAKAIKATLRRPYPSGQVGERDVYGAQQHAPLLDLELDI